MAMSVACCGLLVAHAQAADEANFKLVRTKGLPAGCAAKANAFVHLETLGFAEQLTITVRGFPAGTPLVLFAIQVPNAPFGIGWYVADIQIGADGTARETLISRFNDETGNVAVGTAPAPQTHPADGSNNPTFQPVHNYHLGIWFDSVAAARKAGCPTTVTPFNGDHTAGVQVLNTGTFTDTKGPLSKIN